MHVYHSLLLPCLLLLNFPYFTSPFTSKGTPLQAHRSRSAVLSGGNRGGGGMTHERGGIDWGGGGGEPCVQVKPLASPRL
jgi:hypothetical protein